MQPSGVTITEAVKLTGVSRVTLHRYVKQGRLTRKPDKTFDVAELQRAGFNVTLDATPKKPLETPLQDVAIQRLEDKVATLQHDNETLRVDKADLKRLLDQRELTFQQTLALLGPGKRPGLRDRLRRLWRAVVRQRTYGSPQRGEE